MAGQEHSLAVLLRALQGLMPEDFQELKAKLPEVHVEGRWSIPEDLLAKADNPCTLLRCMTRSCSEDAVMDIVLGLLEEMNQRDLAEKLLEEVLKEYKREYRAHVVLEFFWYDGMDSCLGGNLSVSSCYTDLTVTWNPWSKRLGEREAAGSSCGRTDVGDGEAPITLTTQMLFKPDEDGQTLRVMLLVGAPGMGKTMMVRKVMVEWAEGTLCTQFDYIFCMDCKDLACTKEASVADLISKCCPQRRMPLGKVLAEQKKILFIFDGFEALGYSSAQPEDELISDPREVKPLETTLRSLLKKTILPESSLLITTRPTALQALEGCLESERYAEILGFSAASREHYFHRHFGNDTKAQEAFRFARGNEILYSLCVIPAMSWTVCSILDQEFHKKNHLAECWKGTTQMSMFYLSQLLKSRSQGDPRDLQQFLHKLCSLAADGIWKHKVLFEEKEIKDRGLDQPDLLPLFLNEKISRNGVDHGNIYSFPHLHLQELFAATFYVLEDDKEAVSDSVALMRDVKVLLESYNEFRKDLNFTVRFLFGLVSPESQECVSKTLGCRTSPRAREEVLRWLQGRHRGISRPSQVLKVSELDTFHFLFEMNEKSSVQSTLGQFTDMALQDIQLTLYDQTALSFCVRQWAGLGCITLQGCSFVQAAPGEELSALVPRSHTSGAGGCPHGLTDRLELWSPLHPLCRALRHRGSNLEVLRLQWCGLSESCCVELAALLGEHPSLAQLELSDSTLGDTGVRLLCEGLRQPGCRLRVLR
ncbi:NLRP3 protein, partial [Heliornis fulica]|nr:NLRP3 protein [Heliornis fulica]